ncbi:methyltransferase domain-containing protein [Trichloromonas sp.]|uniref:methyltransferase domain-containing protein n=1 Tax=Trichloromonas sp. TaxID=3069249 RepID=UPI002A4534CC|nr:class I SAM-dependent methyltransferase [Desulfuromonadales bacterium]MDY0269051.1 class I SAM-dependent methyltransferase [Trichloromonas sp.]
MIKEFTTNFIIKKIGNHWTAQRKVTRPARTRWWESPLVVQHYNAQICGYDISGTSQGIVSAIRQRCGSRLPFKHGISVGGSNGWKERILINEGIVEHFTVTEYSEELINEGIDLSEQQKLKNKIDFYLGDAFEKYSDPSSFDFVYWDNSLHHMFDVNSAVSWSRHVLNSNGIFVMNDFVGPNRMQYSDRSIKYASLGRAFLPKKYLSDPYNEGSYLDREIKRCNPIALAVSDPSECADSGRIIDAVKEHFPDASITFTGGTIYNSSLNDILANFDEENETDRCILLLLLQLDKECAFSGESHYAFAMAEKN